MPLAHPKGSNAICREKSMRTFELGLETICARGRRDGTGLWKIYVEED